MARMLVSGGMGVHKALVLVRSLPVRTHVGPRVRETFDTYRSNLRICLKTIRLPYGRQDTKHEEYPWVSRNCYAVCPYVYVWPARMHMRRHHHPEQMVDVRTYAYVPLYHCSIKNTI